MVDVSGVGPLRPVAGSSDRTIRGSARQASAKAEPFRHEVPSQIVRLANQMATEPSIIDSAKVAALRASLANGDFAVDPSKIADALLGKPE